MLHGCLCLPQNPAFLLVSAGSPAAWWVLWHVAIEQISSLALQRAVLLLQESRLVSLTNAPCRPWPIRQRKPTGRTACIPCAWQIYKSLSYFFISPRWARTLTDVVQHAVDAHRSETTESDVELSALKIGC